MSDRRVYRRRQVSHNVNIGTVALLGFMLMLVFCSVIIGRDEISPPKAQPFFSLERAAQLQGSASRIDSQGLCVSSKSASSLRRAL